jgi:hypothetical protein
VLPNAQERFEKLWVINKNNVFCSYDGVKLHWTYDRPPIYNFHEAPD